jgi:hypothetical protein
MTSSHYSLYRKLACLPALLCCLLILTVARRAEAIEKPAVCPCARPRTDKEFLESVKRSETIFFGKLKHDEDNNWAIPLLRTASYRNIFEVQTVWKGEPDKVKIVKTFATDVACGLGNAFFVRGESYLVFAAAKDGTLYTDVCFLNLAEARAAAHVRYFGTGKVPTKSVFYLHGRTKLLITILVAAVLSLGLLVGYYIVRKRLTSTLNE